ncbi:hypothetical protein Bhyg_01810 [Pseudolycoriella hygida]|uniref:BED-type domain-containing protein n=1 Tax=Pseudolycoriella hygida TaxID=35572 RepID=A0A9Q0S5X9_9DIPT|nr:hypothetical protein Bhyg_01810 [Pseudolycoriella hygida]
MIDISNVNDKGHQTVQQAKKSDATESDVWQYFAKNKDKGTATCNVCKLTLKAAGGSTSGLISHAKTQHQINILKRKFVSGLSCVLLFRVRPTHCYK